jgi:hypothetical protein
VLFNAFLNDIFNFVKENKLYNYADDNTLSHSAPDLNGLVKSLEKESAILIAWFANNKMKANSDKFQAIAIGNKSKNEDMKFNLDGNEILCENEVNLLGVTIDCQLKFNTHISEICKKASRQLNVIKRIRKHLSKLGRLTIYHSYNKGNNKITELRTILQRESQNSLLYKQTKSVNNRQIVKTVMTLTWYRQF